MTHIDLIIAFVIGFAFGGWYGIVSLCLMLMRRDADEFEEKT